MHSTINNEELNRRLGELVPGQKADGEISELHKEFHIYFEKISMAGLEEMHRYSIDESLYEFFEFKPFHDISETKAYIEKLLTRMDGKSGEKNAIYWFVRRKNDKHLIGTAGLVNINFGRKSVEWGYGIDPSLWGGGFILQIQELLKHYVFEVLRFNRLDGITMIHNQRTISSLLAAGMKNEGILRQFYCKDGFFIDGWKYSMLSEDYFKKVIPATIHTPKYSTEDVIEVISSILGDEQIDENSTMYSTNSWDSLNHMAIMVALFEKTNISLSPIQIANATSVVSITNLINGLNRL